MFVKLFIVSLLRGKAAEDSLSFLLPLLVHEPLFLELVGGQEGHVLSNFLPSSLLFLPYLNKKSFKNLNIK